MAALMAAPSRISVSSDQSHISH